MYYRDVNRWQPVEMKFMWSIKKQNGIKSEIETSGKF